MLLQDRESEVETFENGRNEANVGRRHSGCYGIGSHCWVRWLTEHELINKLELSHPLFSCKVARPDLTLFGCNNYSDGPYLRNLFSPLWPTFLIVASCDLVKSTHTWQNFLINTRAFSAPFEGSLRHWKRDGNFEVNYAYFEGFSCKAVSKKTRKRPTHFS